VIDAARYLEETRVLVDAALHACLPAEDAPPARLHAAMAYSVRAGGKRLRPILVIAAAEACGAPAARVMPTACALELIHTYSLIHDDLPCMDDDDLRRGKPTNHKVFGETIAVLAGDALQAHAFKLIGDNALVAGVDPAAAAEAARIVGEAASSLGMAGGQAADWLAEGRRVSEEEVAFIHRLKTGALIRAAVAAGAALAGAPPAARAALARYGEALGLLFQITDDILNVEGSAEAMGKATGSDAALGKATYPAVLGLAPAKARAERLLADARAAAAELGPAGELLGGLAEYVLRRVR